jgi:hypothetical protein
MAETTTAAETVATEWVEEFVERWFAAWNSHDVERPLIASDSPRASFRWRGKETNSGLLAPGVAPTGNAFEHPGADFHEYRDGKVARLQILFDKLDPLRDLGLLPDWAASAREQ